MQATVAKAKAHTKPVWYDAPAAEAVANVPGPIKAAEMTDQKKYLEKFFLHKKNRKLQLKLTSVKRWNHILFCFYDTFLA
ncbi:hypothetical protein LVD15_09570 [Fulvivirga maritima]|uniref:hypothetical protein n=1 Tax=Fulvivirga maritima TaxID=2904247 RepID=UPI001F46D9BC|nr:hypothetical protein [Fulvivirga maritima]UII29557.1 hypothetical protein LVD15_09570 [Fulvivirga maritima]